MQRNMTRSMTDTPTTLRCSCGGMLTVLPPGITVSTQGGERHSFTCKSCGSSLTVTLRMAAM